MELEKGMYIRFNGFISKIGHIHTSGKGNKYVQFQQPNGLLASTRYENIDKVSFDIIDLIQQGDYVNGYLVTFVYNPGGNKVVRIELEKDNLRGHIISSSEQIKSIVTKEQFESIKYEVK